MELSFAVSVCNAGAVQGGQGQGAAPSKNSGLPCAPSPMKFMIKHNLLLVRGGSLWQYRSVPPQLQLWPPHCLPNVNHRTATGVMTSVTVTVTVSVQWSVMLLAKYNVRKK